MGEQRQVFISYARADDEDFVNLPSDGEEESSPPSPPESDASEESEESDESDSSDKQEYTSDSNA